MLKADIKAAEKRFQTELHALAKRVVCFWFPILELPYFIEKLEEYRSQSRAVSVS